MLNTIPIKKPEITLKQPTALENLENNINPEWSAKDDQHHLLPSRGLNNGNIMQGLHQKTVNPTPFTSTPSDKVMIGFSKSLQKFTIYDENKNVVGSFTLSHIIKYLGNIYDTERKFLSDINMDIYKSAKEQIKIYLFKIEYNKKTKKSNIIIYDHTQSGLMGDMSLLFKLNNLLQEYILNDLNNDLSNIPEHDKIKIEQNIKKFTYGLLNYTVKLIAILTEKIKDKKDMDDLKMVLLKHSLIYSHRINQFVQEQLSVIYVCDKEIKKAYVTNMEIKNIIKKKLEDLTNDVTKEIKSERIVYNENDALKV